MTKNAHHSPPPSARATAVDEAGHFIIDHYLWLKILIGMGLGVLFGVLLAPAGAIIETQETAYAIGEWVSLPGVLFLGLIKMVIVPLVICSIILGISESGNVSFLGKIGIRILPYFIATTAIAITIGVFLVNIIHPGSAIDPSFAQETMKDAANLYVSSNTFNDLSIPQRIKNIIPENPAQAQLNRDMLQIVVASILVGIALISIPAASAKPIKDLCLSAQILCMKIISWAMAIAPIAVFGLLCNITLRTGLYTLLSVGLYALTVLLGLLCMFALYTLIIWMVNGISPLRYIAKIREAQLLAFSTSSSAATMPFSIQVAEEKLGIRHEISRVIIPLGATINMDGTAMYQAIAALFLCQVFGIDLTMGQTLLLIVTTIGASIGTPATPGVGLVVLATILSNLGIPAEGIALIIGVDRILDMCRTTLNVTGDITASSVMNKIIPKKNAGTA